MANAALAVRKLDAADTDPIADVLTRAFFDYPMITWLMPDEAHRREALPIFMRSSASWGLLMDHAFGAGDPLRGVAIWAPPGVLELDLDPDDSIAHYGDAVAAMGPECEARYDRFLAEQRATRAREMGAGTWYLAWLGIEPAAQRSGIGSALLTDMLARLDADGADAYLETEKAINVPYYERHGFGVMTAGEISGGGPKFWTMRREPQVLTS